MKTRFIRKSYATRIAEEAEAEEEASAFTAHPTTTGASNTDVVTTIATGSSAAGTIGSVASPMQQLLRRRSAAFSNQDLGGMRQQTSMRQGGGSRSPPHHHYHQPQRGGDDGSPPKNGNAITTIPLGDTSDSSFGALMASVRVGGGGGGGGMGDRSQRVDDFGSINIGGGGGTTGQGLRKQTASWRRGDRVVGETNASPPAHQPFGASSSTTSPSPAANRGGQQQQQPARRRVSISSHGINITTEVDVDTAAAAADVGRDIINHMGSTTSGHVDHNPSGLTFAFGDDDGGVDGAATTTGHKKLPPRRRGAGDDDNGDVGPSRTLTRHQSARQQPPITAPSDQLSPELLGLVRVFRQAVEHAIVDGEAEGRAGGGGSGGNNAKGSFKNTLGSGEHRGVGGNNTNQPRLAIPRYVGAELNQACNDVIRYVTQFIKHKRDEFEELLVRHVRWGQPNSGLSESAMQRAEREGPHYLSSMYAVVEALLASIGCDRAILYIRNPYTNALVGIVYGGTQVPIQVPIQIPLTARTEASRTGGSDKTTVHPAVVSFTGNVGVNIASLQDCPSELCVVDAYGPLSGYAMRNMLCVPIGDVCGVSLEHQRMVAAATTGVDRGLFGGGGGGDCTNATNNNQRLFDMMNASMSRGGGGHEVSSTSASRSGGAKNDDDDEEGLTAEEKAAARLETLELLAPPPVVGVLQLINKHRVGGCGVTGGDTTASSSSHGTAANSNGNQHLSFTLSDEVAAASAATQIATIFGWAAMAKVDFLSTKASRMSAQLQHMYNDVRHRQRVGGGNNTAASGGVSGGHSSSGAKKTTPAMIAASPAAALTYHHPNAIIGGGNPKITHTADKALKARQAAEDAAMATAAKETLCTDVVAAVEEAVIKATAEGMLRGKGRDAGPPVVVSVGGANNTNKFAAAFGSSSSSSGRIPRPPTGGGLRPSSSRATSARRPGTGTSTIASGRVGSESNNNNSTASPSAALINRLMQPTMTSAAHCATNTASGDASTTAVNASIEGSNAYSPAAALAKHTAAATAMVKALSERVFASYSVGVKVPAMLAGSVGGGGTTDSQKAGGGGGGGATAAAGGKAHHGGTSPTKGSTSTTTTASNTAAAFAAATYGTPLVIHRVLNRHPIVLNEDVRADVEALMRLVGGGGGNSSSGEGDSGSSGEVGTKGLGDMFSFPSSSNAEGNRAANKTGGTTTNKGGSGGVRIMFTPQQATVVEASQAYQHIKHAWKHTHAQLTAANERLRVLEYELQRERSKALALEGVCRRGGLSVPTTLLTSPTIPTSSATTGGSGGNGAVDADVGRVGFASTDIFASPSSPTDQPPRTTPSGESGGGGRGNDPAIEFPPFDFAAMRRTTTEAQAALILPKRSIASSTATMNPSSATTAGAVGRPSSPFAMVPTK